MYAKAHLQTDTPLSNYPIKRDAGAAAKLMAEQPKVLSNKKKCERNGRVAMRIK